MKKAVLFTVSVGLIIAAFMWHFFLRGYVLLSSAERFIDGFYDQYNAQDFNYIYDILSDQKIRSRMSPEQFRQMMQTSYNHLGQVEGRKRTDWKAAFGRKGTFITLSYEVKRAKVSSSDKFTLRKRNKEWFIFDYLIRGTIIEDKTKSNKKINSGDQVQK